MKSFALPKATILRKKGDFSVVINEGVTTTSKFFRAFCIAGSELQVGFTVQHGYKNKVTRNKLKRRLREMWRLYHASYNIAGKIVLLINVSALNRDFKEIKSDFEYLMKKLENM